MSNGGTPITNTEYGITGKNVMKVYFARQGDAELWNIHVSDTVVNPSVRRGVFMESTVYSISYGGVIAKDSNDLSAEGTSLALGSPQVNQGYGPEACY